MIEARRRFFGPSLSKRMAESFRSTGGPVDYRLLPPVGNEGHYLIYSAEAERYWSATADRFLASLTGNRRP